MALLNGIFGQTFMDCFDGSDQILDYANDTINVVLLEDGWSPNFDNSTSALANIESEAAGTSVTGTGTFTGALASKTIDITTTADYITFDAADQVFSTLTSDSPHIQGCAIYDDTLATPQVKPIIAVVDFATNYAVTAGNFTITWAATGVFRLGLT